MLLASSMGSSFQVRDSCGNLCVLQPPTVDWHLCYAVSANWLAQGLLALSTNHVIRSSILQTTRDIDKSHSLQQWSLKAVAKKRFSCGMDQILPGLTTVRERLYTSNQIVMLRVDPTSKDMPAAELSARVRKRLEAAQLDTKVCCSCWWCLLFFREHLHIRYHLVSYRSGQFSSSASSVVVVGVYI